MSYTTKHNITEIEQILINYLAPHLEAIIGPYIGLPHHGFCGFGVVDVEDQNLVNLIEDPQYARTKLEEAVKQCVDYYKSKNKKRLPSSYTLTVRQDDRKAERVYLKVAGM